MIDLRRATRWSGLACILIIVILSLLPANDMARTGAPKWIEHFAAYAGTSFLLALGLRRPTFMLAIPIGLAALSGAMEVLQQLSPGRTMHLIDFLASSAGALAGTVSAALAAVLMSSGART